jgi:serine protease
LYVCKKKTMKKIIILLLLSGFFSVLNAQTIHQDYWDGVVYFKFHNESGIKLPELRKGMDAQIEFSDYPFYANLCQQFEIYEFLCPFKTKATDIQNIYRIKFSNIQQVDMLVRTLAEIHDVEYAEKSPILRLFLTPNDPDQNQQYYLSLIQAYEAWDLGTGSEVIKVAIVDDAVRVTHPDLAANIWVNPGEIPGNSIDDDGNGYIDDVSGWDAADEDNDPNAPLTPPAIWGEMAFTHGTHCSGIAAGVTNNNEGIASISHNVSLIPIKSVTDGSWIPISIETPAEGVDYAIAAGAHIVSMSFGGEQASGFTTLETLINTGHGLGMIFVAAAGNNGDGNGGFGTPNAINYPAGFTNVLAVGATDSLDVKPGFSQYGDWLDVMAPGVAIYSSLAWSAPYGNQDGTSMACPLVAGTLALMKSFMPHATKEQMIQCLKEGCDNIDAQNPTFIGQMGSGRINAYNSLVCLQQFQSISIVSDNSFMIVPNPADEMMRISFSNHGPKSMKIYSICGTLINEFSTTELVLEIETSSFPDGIYLCIVTDKLTTSVQKIVISH